MALLSKTIIDDGVAEDVTFTDQQGNVYTRTYSVIKQMEEWDDILKTCYFYLSTYKNQQAKESGIPPLRKIRFELTPAEFEAYVSASALTVYKDNANALYNYLSNYTPDEVYDPNDYVPTPDEL